MIILASLSITFRSQPNYKIGRDMIIIGHDLIVITSQPIDN